MPSIFVCYRRDDASGQAGRLSDTLRGEFGDNNVVLDVDTVEPGQDFVPVIRGRLSTCDAMVAIVGPHWLRILNERARVQDQPDHVALELELALNREMLIIPVLVQGAQMPRESELPVKLRPFARRESVELRDTRWQADVRRLIATFGKESSGQIIIDMATQVSRDVSLASRRLKAAGFFTIIALLTLAVAIGTTTAVLSIARGVLLRQPAYAGADRLVYLSEWHSGAPRQRSVRWLSNLTYHAWNGQSHTIGPIAAYAVRDYVVGASPPVVVRGASVSPALFAILQVGPLLGRSFAEEDALEGAPRVVLLSHRLWTESFGGDGSVINRAMLIDGEPHAVIGVVPPNFEYPDSTARLWTPASVPRPVASNGKPRVSATSAIARLAANATPPTAAEEGTAVARTQSRPPETEVIWGKGGPVEVEVRTLLEEITASARPLLLILFAGAGCLLMIACATVAHMLLTRGAAREREIAVQIALGAGQPRLVLQRLIESLVIGLTAGFLGMALAAALVRVLSAVLPAEIVARGGIRLDRYMVTIGFFVSVTTGLLSGIIPALKNPRHYLTLALRPATSATGDRQTTRLSRYLLVTQVSIAAILVVVAILLARSLLRHVGRDRGFDASHVLVTRLHVPETDRDADNLAGSLTERLRTIVGVEAVGVGTISPVDRLGLATDVIVRRSGREAVSAAAYVNVVSAGYAQVLRMVLLKGRLLTEDDASAGSRALVVNDRFVRMFLGDTDPLDANVRGTFIPVDRTIVGVVKNVSRGGLQDAALPEVYIPNGGPRSLGRRISVVIRSNNDPKAMTTDARRILSQLSSEAALEEVRPLSTELAASIRAEMVTITTLTGLAVVAILVVAGGLHGLLSYALARRRREVAIRVALGAQLRDLVRFIVQHSLRITATGLLVGLAGAAAVSWIVQSRFLGRDYQWEPEAFLLTSLILVLVAVGASFLQGVRAARALPAEALHDE